MTVLNPDPTLEVAHNWWRKISLSYVPVHESAMVDEFSANLLERFRQAGHSISETPDPQTEVLLTTAKFNQPVRWRDAMIFTARRQFQLEHSPTVFTIVEVTPEELQARLDYFAGVLMKDPADPKDFQLPGLGPEAYHTLYEQGKRGGPILSLLRTVQTQAMSIRVILLVGYDTPKEAYVFDLVGAHPCINAADKEQFYTDIMGRIVTAMSTNEITQHELVGEPVPQKVWKTLKTPAEMQRAGTELGKRQFFTEMVLVTNLATVPSVPDAIASQYSEGCFATWDPVISALVTTVTGSARPVVKDQLTDDELAVIVGVRPDGRGAQIQHVEGKRNDPPSSEAVELMEMDHDLPRIKLEQGVEVPVSRSKLHGHRGVKVYHPEHVEHVFLEAPYYHFPVSCSTEAQAHAIHDAFSKSVAFQNPDDPRKVVFTILPGHGIVIAEKWVPGKVPFQVIWEYMDAGWLVIDNFVPQGPLTFKPDDSGMMVLNIE
ncbi:MAG: hypothetical protein ACK2UE_16120 [Anaerolineales bacterium]